jgi:hypothetical protein
MSHSLIFSHPDVDADIGSLTITTGMNRVSWAYNLNTQAYPTYAGEVVQILSCNIDNLQIEGDVRSYAEMEAIYRWFLLYMQKATQGAGGDSYVEKAVKLEYPHRGWTMFIKPIQLPALRYGRDVVVPSWSMQAHVVNPDPEQAELSIDNAVGVAGQIENFEARVSADIGFRRSNPFSDPLATITQEENKLYPGASDIAGIKVQGSGQAAGDLGVALQGLAKQMQSMFEALMSGDVKDLIQSSDVGSKPATSTGSSSEQTKTP